MIEKYPDGHEIYWVYMRNGPRSWTVGFYDRSGQWRHQKTYFAQDAAAAYVNKLNSSRVRVRVVRALVGMDCQR